MPESAILRPRHTLRLFADDASFAAGVGGFLMEGGRNGEPVVAIATPRIHALLEPYRRTAAAAGAVWSTLDARDSLGRVLVAGRPDAPRFDAFMAGVAANLGGSKGFRAFGQMVDLLAADGDWEGALALERLWNGFASRHELALLCGYSAEHAQAGPRDTVRHVCLEHDAVEAVDVKARGVVDLLGLR